MAPRITNIIIRHDIAVKTIQSCNDNGLRTGCQSYIVRHHSNEIINTVTRRQIKPLNIKSLTLKNEADHFPRLKFIGGSRGRQGRAPPPGSKFFHFHAVFGKKLEK